MKIFVPHAEVSRGGGLQSLLTTEADRSVFRCTNGKPWGWGGGHSLEPCTKAKALLAQWM